MAAKPLPPVEVLRKLFSYDPETGLIRWVSGARSGKRAFASKNDQGYFVGWAGCGVFKAHRIAWAIHHGESPKGEIDHIDGNRDNNRIENLREVGGCENQQNAALKRSNKSGVCGVYWDRKEGKWRAFLTADRKRFYLGDYPKIEDAIAARLEAQAKFSFTDRHGKPLKQQR